MSQQGGMEQPGATYNGPIYLQRLSFLGRTHGLLGFAVDTPPGADPGEGHRCQLTALPEPYQGSQKKDVVA